MRILIFTNQYGKSNNYVIGFTKENVSYHCVYPTNAIEATDENVKEFLKRFNQFTVQSVEYVNGIVKWNTVDTLYTGKGV